MIRYVYARIIGRTVGGLLGKNKIPTAFNNENSIRQHLIKIKPKDVIQVLLNITEHV